MSFSPFEVLGLKGKYKILHLSWIAFFISFLVWFNQAPLLVLIQQELGISNAQVETLLLLNVALTIPARVIIGLVVDRFGARISYSVLLALVYWLEEPRNFITEIMPDGSSVKIELD